MSCILMSSKTNKIYRIVCYHTTAGHRGGRVRGSRLLSKALHSQGARRQKGQFVGTTSLIVLIVAVVVIVVALLGILAAKRKKSAG